MELKVVKLEPSTNRSSQLKSTAGKVTVALDQGVGLLGALGLIKIRKY